jgi:hypothetical protein
MGYHYDLIIAQPDIHGNRHQKGIIVIRDDRTVRHAMTLTPATALAIE